MVYLDIKKQRNTLLAVRYLCEHEKVQVKELSSATGIPFSAADRKLKELAELKLAVIHEVENRTVGKPPKIYSLNSGELNKLFSTYIGGEHELESEELGEISQEKIVRVALANQDQDLLEDLDQFFHQLAAEDFEIKYGYKGLVPIIKSKKFERQPEEYRRAVRAAAIRAKYKELTQKEIEELVKRFYQ